MNFIQFLSWKLVSFIYLADDIKYIDFLIVEFCIFLESFEKVWLICWERLLKILLTCFSLYELHEVAFNFVEGPRFHVFGEVDSESCYDSKLNYHN